MKIHSIEQIITSLNQAKVEYLVAGGLAVVAHGYLRFTADLDLILHLEDKNVLKAMQALKELGYKPRAPVPIEAFADESERKRWIEEKNLKVLSLWSQQHPATEVDIFVEEPFDFDKLYRRGVPYSVEKSVQAKVLSLDDLIALKKAAGRRKDMDDIENLLLIQKKKAKE